jgi:hypothetical protein
MNRAWMGIAAVAMLSGCLGPGAEQKPDSDDTKRDSGKAEAWSSSDSPALFNSALEFRIAELPMTGQATNIPWASSYWPVYQDSINYKWEGAGTESSAKKFERAFGVTGVEDAVSQYHGINAQSSRKECTQASDCTDLKDGSTCAKRDGQEKGRCIPTWWGICHAWAPAAILTPEPKYPVTLNGVTFKVNDIKSLVTLAHNSTNTKFVSLRCNKDDAADPATITYDEYGRPNDASRECRDTNPGTYHVLLTNYLGKQGAAFVEDRTFDDEVWNQPLRGYNITEQREVTAAEANKLIGVTTVGGTTLNKTGTVAKAVWSHQGSYPVVAGQAIKVRMTGTGDADLHVRFGAEPTDTAYDCRPYAGSSDETCELTVPAGVTAAFVSVLGYADASSFSLAITTGGMVPQNYHFNANAVKFYSVKLDVKYISEASSSTDGNLSSTIDRYTHNDHYEYILEVDANGKIIGGEWIGASKKAHPDFVWLPISVGSTSVAGGKITYARVKELLDKSMNPPGGGGTTTPTEKVVNESGTVAKDAWKHYGPFNVGAGANLTATMTGDNDADLYVRKGAAPTTASYDCRPYKSGSAEACTVVGPGAVYVSVRGYAASSNFVLKVTYTEGGGTTPTPVDPPATVTHLNVTGTVGLGEQKHYQLSVPAGAKLVIKTAAPNDVDLYIQMGAAPTPEAYLARAWTSSGNETINYTATGNGTLHIMVHGYAASSFTLTTATAP